MFGKERRRLEDTTRNNPESIIAGNTIIAGKISGSDAVRIVGQFEGEIRSEGLVIISAQGKVNADISCESLILEGTVNGNVVQAGTVEIRGSGRIHGNITCDRIALAEGAFVDGAIHMSASETTPSEFAEKRKRDEK